MMKRLVISVACVAFALQLAGCSSSSSSDEGSGGDETFAEEGSGDFQEDGGDDLNIDGDEASSDTSTADSGEGDDLSLEDENQDASETASTSPEDSAGGDDAAGDDLSLDDEPVDQPVAQETPPEQPIEQPAEQPVEQPVVQETPVAPETPSDNVATEPVRSTVSAPAVFFPVTKIRTAPFAAGDTNLNRVYIGRTGDSAKSIAKRIYGSDTRAKDLRKWNPSLSNGVTVGEKVYYQSPANPADTNMLTYYEDVGIAPQVYVTKSGDNIRTVSKDLLGHRDSWKEVWSTNLDVESKANVPEGLNLRYWPDQPVQTPVVAATPPQEIPPLTQTDPTLAPVEQPPVTGGNFQPVDTLPVAQASPAPVAPTTPPNDPFAAPSPDPMLAATTPPASAPPTDPTANPPPTDPTQVAATDPTPDPNVPATTDPAQAPPAEAPAVAQAEGGADSMMLIGMAGIVILAGAAVFLILKKRKPKSVDLTQTTQVG